MKRGKNTMFCIKIDASGLIFEKHINIDFHQFICLFPVGCKLLKINSSFRTEAKNINQYLHPLFTNQFFIGH
jgi:hypothetical protein